MLRKIVLDTETTGLYVKNGDRIIEIGCVELINNSICDRFHRFINPQKEVNPAAFNIHGISNEFLQDKPLFHEIADDFLNFIGTSNLIIHNAGFDIGFLNAELERLGYQALNTGRVEDTLLKARAKFPGAPASLDALCKRFNISLEKRTFHGALLDAELLAKVYIELEGGLQSNINFDVKKAFEEKNARLASRKKRNPRTFEISEEELARHRAFVKQFSS